MEDAWSLPHPASLQRKMKSGRMKYMTTRVARRITTVGREFIVMILHWIGGFPSHHVRRLFYRFAGMEIGEGSSIHMGLKIYAPAGIKIGKDTIIGEDTILDGRGPIVIGNHVAFATGVMIYNSQHDIRDPQFGAITKEVHIGDYVFVGPRAIILPGVHVGAGAVIGAGAVVTKNVAPGVVVGGVPAVPIGDRPLQHYSYKLGRAAWFR